MFIAAFFRRRREKAQLLSRASERLGSLTARRKAIEVTRLADLRRQVELWSVMNLDSSGEEEYFAVSRRIADRVKEEAAIDEYLANVRQASVRCNSASQCEELGSLLAIDDPWQEKLRQGRQDELPKVALKI